MATTSDAPVSTSQLDALAAPAADDYWMIVDASDTSLAATGKSKRVTVAALNAALDHGTLAGLGGDDHPLYHTDARALTWLGTRSTSDLPEGARLYYTDARADARVAAGLAAWSGSAALTTVGTITAGTWRGAVIAPAYLGTGTPAAGTYLDGGTGAWTALPAGGGVDPATVVTVADAQTVTGAKTLTAALTLDSGAGTATTSPALTLAARDAGGVARSGSLRYVGGSFLRADSAGAAASLVLFDNGQAKLAGSTLYLAGTVVNDAGGTLLVVPANAGFPALAARAAAGQTANVFEVRDKDDVPRVYVDSAGVLHGDGSGLTNLPGGTGGSGTVTAVSVATANGFGGTVATATTTPAITITTGVVGLLKGDGTGVAAAAPGVDYLAPAAVGVSVQAWDAGLDAVAAASAARGTLLVGDGTAWAALAPGVDGKVLKADSAAPAGLSWQDDLTGSGGTGITTLNGLTADPQTFATGAAGTDFGVSSAGSTHTFNLPDASGTARGAVTTGVQTFAGAKTLTADLTLDAGAGASTASPALLLAARDSGGVARAVKVQYHSGDPAGSYAEVTAPRGGAALWLWDNDALTLNAGSLLVRGTVINDASGTVLVRPLNAGYVGLAVQARSGQTGNPLEVRDKDNVPQVYVTGTFGLVAAVRAAAINAADAGAFDLDLADTHTRTLDGTNGVLSLAGAPTASPWRRFTVVLTQDATGGRGVTWFAGVRWPGGAEPTLTATPGKSDTFVFLQLGAGDFLGFVAGQNS